MKRGLVLGLLMTLPLVAAAGTFPRQVTIEYRGYWRFLPVGSAVQTWSLQGNRYHLETRMSGFGKAVRYVSDGMVANDQLLPLQYGEYRDKNTSPTYVARFDWNAKQVVYGRTNEPPKSGELVAPAQDLNTVPYDLAWRDARPVAYAIVTNGRSIKGAGLARAGEDSYDVGDTEVETVHLVSRRGDETTDFWLAPALYHLPVRIKYNGSEKIELKATKIIVDGRTVAE